MKSRQRPLIETDRLAHGALQVQRLDVLPVLLEQRDQKVNGQHVVVDNLILAHGNVTGGNTQTEHLLELETDGRLDLIDLFLQVVQMRHGRRELAGCEVGFVGVYCDEEIWP